MLHSRIQLPFFRSAKNMVVGPDSIMSLRAIESSSVVIVTSKSFYNNKKIFENFYNNIRATKKHIIKSTWSSDPSLDELREPLSIVEKYSPDVFIAVGGGSVIDATKIIWMFYEQPEIKSDTYLKINAIPPLRGRAKFIAIPTTTGTGSEVSSSALIIDKERGVKVPIVTHDFLPDIVVLDPNLLIDLPEDIFISTCCDALSHSIEGFVSRLNNPLMDQFALTSIRIIFENIEKALQYRDVSSIGNLQYAATMAGWVQNHCLVGGSHAIAHQLHHYGISHGVANAILLPEVIALNSSNEKVANKYSFISDQCTKGIKLSSKLKRFRNLGQFSVNLSDYGKIIEKKVIEGALFDPAAKTNPIQVDEEYVQTILQLCK